MPVGITWERHFQEYRLKSSKNSGLAAVLQDAKQVNAKLIKHLTEQEGSYAAVLRKNYLGVKSDLESLEEMNEEVYSEARKKLEKRRIQLKSALDEGLAAELRDAKGLNALRASTKTSDISSTLTLGGLEKGASSKSVSGRSLTLAWFRSI
jgi:hypothetical protein